MTANDLLHFALASGADTSEAKCTVSLKRTDTDDGSSARATLTSLPPSLDPDEISKAAAHGISLAHSQGAAQRKGDRLTGAAASSYVRAVLARSADDLPAPTARPRNRVKNAETAPAGANGSK